MEVTGVGEILDFARFCVVFDNSVVVVRQVIWSCTTTNWRSTQRVPLIRRNL